METAAVQTDGQPSQESGNIVKKDDVYMEDVTIVLPIVKNGVSGLGELWNCHSSETTNQNLFKKQLESEHLIAHPLKKLEYSLTHIKGTEDQIAMVKAHGSIGLELLCGLIKVEGLADYSNKSVRSVNEEKIICQYNLENFSISLLPRANMEIDEHVHTQLMKGSIKATHVAFRVILGAEVNAHVLVTRNETKRSGGISGNALGKLGFGKVTASLKAQLEWLDTSEANDYRTQINIHSKPPMKRQPSTVKEMFELVENIDVSVANEQHYKFSDANITGVPIRWVLVPIAQYLDIDVEKLYLQISETLLCDFRAMLISLQDSRQPDCIKRRVLEKEHRLQCVLSDSSSPLSRDISQYEKILNKNVESFFICACKALRDYKQAAITSRELHKLIEEYEMSNFSAIDIYTKVDKFVMDGKHELDGIHEKDVTQMEAKICTFTNRELLNEWMNTESNIKILLQTKGGRSSGVFHRLFKISHALKEQNIDVGIALPSISDDFSLTIKAREHQKCNQVADIPLILGIVGAIVTTDSSVENQFYTIMASRFNITLPLQTNELKELNRLVELLKIGDVHIASSYMESLECLMSGDYHWMFFVPLDALDTAYESIVGLGDNLKRLACANGKWVVGRLDIVNQHEAPLLFVLHDKEVKAICLDHLDIMILVDLFNKAATSEHNEPDLSVLSPESLKCSIYHNRAAYAVKAMELMDQANHSEHNYNHLRMQSFEDNVDEKLTDALHIVRSCLSRVDMNVIAMVTHFAIRDNPKISSILEKHGWRNVDCSFGKVHLELQDCELISTGLQEWLSSENQDGMTHVKSLISILKQMYKNDSYCFNAYDVINIYVGRIDFSNFQYSNSNTFIDQCIERHQLHALIQHLSKLQYNRHLVMLQLAFDKLKEVNEPKAVVGVLQLLSNLGLQENQWEDLWTNSSFKYLIRRVIEDFDVLQTMNLMDHIFIPSEFQDKFPCNSVSLMPNDFSSLESVLSTFQKIITLKEIPRHFTSKFVQSIAKDATLEKSLNEANALIYWKERDKQFSEVWSLQTIKDAVKNIHKFNKNKESAELRRMQRDVGIDVKVDRQATTSSVQVKKAVVMVREDWHSVFGKSLPMITTYEYVMVRGVIKQPDFSSEQTSSIMNEALPYFMQTFKMWGGNILRADAICRLCQRETATVIGHASKRPNFTANIGNARNAQQTRQKNKASLSRLDCIVALLSAADCTVVQEMLQIMTKFPMALPLVMPDLELAGKLKVMLLLFAGNTIKWESQPGVIAENHLFLSPFRLILAVRLGSGSCGKSTILNQLMAVENMFSSCGEPGAQRGPPLTLAGTVEFTWLTQETCSASLWESVMQEFYLQGQQEIVLLANLHGDALEHPTTLEFLKTFTSAYLIFMMPGTKNILAKRNEEFVKHARSEDESFFLLVDPSADCDEADEIIIQTSTLTKDATLEKVRSIFKEILKIPSQKITLNRKLESNEICDPLSLAHGIECFESQRVIDFVQQKTCKDIRKAMHFQMHTTSQRTNLIRSWRDNEILQQLMTLYGAVLSLPLSERLKAMAHLERDISLLSNAESSNIRQKVATKIEDLQGQIVQKSQDKTFVNKIKMDINDNLKELDHMCLGLEHFFRELGHIYEIVQGGQSKNEDILTFPKLYGELLTQGHAIELLNGDTSEMPGAWLADIFQHISRNFPTLRIFVISILGLQSSGKSTLLNALFACKFAVSVGRCTRGLFMRLLFLEEKLVKKLKCDVIVLIDTEGLGAPEKMSDDNAEQKDRILATFAMSVSNLTLINVLGEYMRDLAEILQIAIVAMARLEEVKMAPDILMVQHLTERNSAMMSSAQNQFCQAIEKALELTEKKDFDTGIADVSCLKNLTDRIQNGKLLKQFRPFKNGASAGSPPSAQYHEDVMDLYKTILDTCAKSGGSVLFSEWHSRLQSFWSCISKDNFAVRFKNIKEIYEFIDRGHRIAAVKEAADAAFFLHTEKLKRQMRTMVQDWNEKTQHLPYQNVLRLFEKELKVVPYGCNDGASKTFRCKACEDVSTKIYSLQAYAKKKHCELEIMKTVNSYVQRIRQSNLTILTQILDAAVVRQGCSEQFFKEIKRCLKTELMKRPAGDFSDEERSIIVENILSSLSRIATSMRKDLPDDRKLKEELEDEYEQAPSVSARYGNKTPLKSFGIREVEAVAVQKNRWSPPLKCPWLPKKIDNSIIENIALLENDLESLPKLILKDKKAEHFENGMIRELKKRIETSIRLYEEKQHVKLPTDIKWEAHLFTLRKFGELMSVCQDKWEKQHCPIAILQQKREEFRAIIDIQLRGGFSSASEGRIISKYLLDAIRQRSIKSANRKKVEAVLDLHWTTNSEKVRLTYFEHLATQVDKKQTAEALQHFAHPNSTIENWFSKRVDSHACGKTTEAFKATYTAELKHVVQEIRNCQDIASVQKFTRDYLTHAEDLEYKSCLDKQAVSQMDISLLRDSVLEVLNDAEAKEDPESVNFVAPSTDKRVQSRLGCTAQCCWCGALCWGSRGHHENDDDTKAHHSCHQPRGLHGTHYRDTKHLSAVPCNLLVDNCRVYWGDKCMKWSEAKATEFKTWKFDAHCNDKFDALMRWFFEMLNEEIAASRKLLPATKEELVKYECQNLEHRSILAGIRVALK
uniref:Interferon-induced very large GTPase 1-like n=1 Tax=Petromyzon marinus TaxID=7757 RepID=A0AAJ7XHK8_PETMA|nr:interferon-induced very large GTPase 1-like [Petromyzon marinus]XP_032834728.1 interferon-induced very large GTPase 1-like [Petromyzon marinus]